VSALASLSATAAHTWLKCGRRATHKYIHGHREELDYDPVAIRFGNLVHESITGEENDFSKPVEYDQHTQNHHHPVRPGRGIAVCPTPQVRSG